MFSVLHDLALYCGLLVGDARRVVEICYSEATAIQTLVRARIRGNQLKHDVWSHSSLNEPIDLLKHHKRSADRPTQDPFIQHDPECRWIRLIENFLPFQPSGHEFVDLIPGHANASAEQSPGDRKS